MIINRDLNIDQNNRDYHFGRNRAALISIQAFAAKPCATPTVVLKGNRLKGFSICATYILTRDDNRYKHSCYGQ